jgi:hypothetical protein
LDDFAKKSQASPLPAAVGGGDDMLLFVHQQHRQAIGRLDDEKNAGPASDHGVSLQAFPRRLGDKMDNIGMDLTEEQKRKIPPFFLLAKRLRCPSGVAEAVDKERNPFDPGDGHNFGSHL